MRQSLALLLACAFLVADSGPRSLAPGTCAPSLLAFQSGCAGSYPSINFDPPAHIGLFATVVGGTASSQELADFNQRLRAAAAGWEDYLHSYGIATTIHVEDESNSASHLVNITDQIAEGQAFTNQPLEGGSGTMTVPLEWLTNPMFIEDYVRTVLAHEVGHFVGFQQHTTAGVSIMSDTTFAN